jgi:hypothetical protein
VLRQPAAIVIVDGLFERTPTVWHKEILWALRDGIRVYGAASIGALRAAELEAFGMIGVGQIFSDYAAGLLEDDDEVAIVHGPEELGYIAASEAMVNIRASFAAAVAQGVLDEEGAQKLTAAAKALNYTERTYERILANADLGNIAESGQLDRLSIWLFGSKINQKKSDAISVIDRVIEDHHGGLAAAPVAWHFAFTDRWERVIREENQISSKSVAPVALSDEERAVLDEVWLDAETWNDLQETAQRRALAAQHARSCQVTVQPQARQQTAVALMANAGLDTPDKIMAFMTRNRFDTDSFMALADEEALVQTGHLILGDRGTSILSQLKIADKYAEYAERAQKKAAALAATGPDTATPDNIGLDFNELLNWFFCEHHGKSVPDDLEGYAKSSGFADSGAMMSVIARHYAHLNDGKVRAAARRGKNPRD